MCKRKRYFVVGFIFVSILGTLSHFFYQWSGENPIVGLFSSVDESVREHMKLLFFPAILYLIIFYRKLKIQCKGAITSTALGIIVGTFLIPILFYSYTGILGYNLAPVDISIFYISTAVTFVIGYQCSDSDRLSAFQPIFLGILTFMSLVFMLLTYIP